MEDCKNFFIQIEKFKPYVLELKKDGIMKPKIYLFNCIVKKNERLFIIVITYNKYIFFTNNRVWRAWTHKNDMFLQYKDKKQDILTFGFFLSYKQLNFVFLILKKREEVIQQIGL